MLTLTNVANRCCTPIVTQNTTTRGSIRSRGAAALSGLTLRQISAVMPPERTWGLWASRQIVARVMGAFGPSLAGALIEHVDARLPDGRRVVGEWVCAPGVEHAESGPAIYYLHGSGYALCSAKTHRRLTAWLSRLTGLPVFCLDYRLAPRHRFPAAADDVRAGWNWLIDDQGLSPERLVVAGDSAGGHLAVDLLLQLDVSVRRPAGLVLFSPLIDLTFTLARAREALRKDPAIRADDAARLLRLYCGDVDPDHPRLALDIAGGPAMPPSLIQAGGTEILAADAHYLATQIRLAGGTCDLTVWPGQAHVFQALPRMTPEAGRAMKDVVAFIADVVPTVSNQEAAV